MHPEPHPNSASSSFNHSVFGAVSMNWMILMLTADRHRTNLIAIWTRQFRSGLDCNTSGVTSTDFRFA